MNKYFLGLLLLVAVASIWTISSFVVQEILSTNAVPFFLTYFANSLFMLQLPVVLCYRYYHRIPPYNTNEGPSDYTPLDHVLTVKPRAPCKDYIKGLYHGPTLRAAFIVMPLWFMANGLYNISLGMTSVTSNTVISATSGMFTFAIAVRAGQEQFSWWKIAGVVCSIGGTVLTAVADTSPPSTTHRNVSSPSSSSNSMPNTLLGDIVCLFAAVFYGLYTTAIHRFLPSIQFTNLFFGYLGVIGCVVCAPIVLVLCATKVENLASISASTLVLIALKGLFDNVLSDTLWAVALKWTSPTVATLGLALTIPLSIVAAVLIGKGIPTWLSGSGAVFMLVGFVCVNVPGGRKQDEEARVVVAQEEEVPVLDDGT